ncbi:MAG: ribonuclease H-like domain-containing protein [Candidatus Aminicenantes bacterium]
MTDIKEKLERLKRERQARIRSSSFQEVWAEIEKKEGLTTKEKLEQLITLRGRIKSEKPRPEPHPAIMDREEIQFTETPYSMEARYGHIRVSQGLEISGETLAHLSNDPGFEELNLSTALFIDLETTGLSGGAGVVPFNIGMGYYRDHKFWVGQFFLGELAHEGKMLQELDRFLQDMDFQSVVTYNGKAFDIPLLETRSVLHRIPFRLGALPHLDFLFPARCLWKHKFESCRLAYLAREVVGTYREDDIPSAEVPVRYFEYLRTGNFELVEPVLYHNAEDILSLLGVVVIGASVFSDNEETCMADAMDFFGAGKVMERRGDPEAASRFFGKALDGDLDEETGMSTRRRLSLHFKRSRNWDQALTLWKEMAVVESPSPDLLFSLRELAMYYEHRLKDFQTAFKFAEEGYVVSRGFSDHYENDFFHRKERLKKKMKE